ncbi:MAG TPA: hypothetical protein VMC85_15700 [Desulfomonilaceae bacterium]|nr:hypothetical protein [Desulfomonilaceae bacterium]
MRKSEENPAKVNKWALSLLSCGVLFLMFSFLVQPCVAVEDNDISTDTANTENSAEDETKCWKKMPPLDERHILPEYGTVCEAYEELLNTVCEPPEKLGSNWTVPPGDKRFRKLRWVELDPRDYWGLIRDLSVCGLREDLREGKWKTEETQEKKAIDEGKRRLSVTTVDIDQDGHEEQVVRYEFLPCKDNPSSIFGVMDPQTKRMDWKRYKALGGVNSFAYYGNEILLYEGKAFTFKIEETFYDRTPEKEVMLYEGFSLFGGSTFGNINLCRFKYLKEGK